MKISLEIPAVCYKKKPGETKQTYLWKACSSDSQRVEFQKIQIYPDYMKDWRLSKTRCYLKKYTGNFTQFNAEWTSLVITGRERLGIGQMHLDVQIHLQKPEERFIEYKRPSTPPLLLAECVCVHPALPGPCFNTNKPYSAVIILLLSWVMSFNL